MCPYDLRGNYCLWRDQVRQASPLTVINSFAHFKTERETVVMAPVIAALLGSSFRLIIANPGLSGIHSPFGQSGLVED